MSLLSDGIDDYEGETEAMGFERYGVPEVRRQVEAAKALFDRLKPQMARVDPERRKSWDSFLQRWENFYQTTQGVEGAFTQFKDSTYEQTLAYQRGAEGLEKALLSTKPSELAKPVNKKTTVQKSSSSPSAYSWSPSIGWDVPWMSILKCSAIVGGGAWVGHKMYRHYHPLGRLTAAHKEPPEQQMSEIEQPATTE